MSSSRKLIYFCGSKFGGRQDELLFNILFDKLEKYGEVIKPFDPEKGINQIGRRSDHGLSMHDRDVALLIMCDVVVAEVTYPSLGVGYEIGRAVELGKPVLCLYRPQPRKKLSSMLCGMDNNDYLRIYDYALAQVDQIFEDFIPKYTDFNIPEVEYLGQEHYQFQASKQANLPPGLGHKNLTKYQLKNKKRRESPGNKANKKASPAQIDESIGNQCVNDMRISDLEKEKKIRKLNDKIKSIQKIKQQQFEGKTLESNQLEKLSKEQEFFDELESLKLS